ncbi:MAG: 50S ribosomal protein L4 [Candidatus Pacebacteria bacterium]|nr:50S ribosomal protein L4 [Candidatus Paceibacterota bacterium]
MEMQSAWIELEKGTQAVHDEVVAFLAMRRAGTASTKTRSEVRGGGAKPYRQKGTGRARAGSIRSPLWSGGGVIFGPKPRSYAKKVNKKVRQLALKRAFSERVAEGAVMVVDEITVAQPKTKAVRELLQSLKAGTDVLVIPAEVSETLLLASRNMPSVEVMEPTAVNTYWMLLFKKVVFTRAGLEAFVKRFAPKEEQA